MKPDIRALNNGFRVVTAPMTNRKSVAIGIWAKVGGRDESPRVNGVSHFLEHLLFKGTTSRSAKEIKESVEGVGGSFNAFTSEEYTCYFAKVSSRHLESVLDVLCDMILNATLASGDIEKERSVILEEIKMTQDQPSQQVDELLTDLLWSGHALGMPLAGTERSVRGLTREDIVAYRDRLYVPPLLTVTAAGDVDARSFFKRVEKRLKGVPSAKNPKSFSRFKRRPRSPKLKLLSKKVEQTHLALGLHGFPKDHPEGYVTSVLGVLLGGNMSSRLFNEVREERGLAYEIGAYTKKYRDTGAFVVEAGVDNQKAFEALALILKELHRVTRERVPADELKRAKDFYLGQLELSLENSMDTMLWVGESIVCLGKWRRLEEVTRQIEKIQPEDLQRVARKIFQSRALHLAAIGPDAEKAEKRFQALLQFP